MSQIDFNTITRLNGRPLFVAAMTRGRSIIRAFVRHVAGLKSRTQFATSYLGVSISNACVTIFYTFLFLNESYRCLYQKNITKTIIQSQASRQSAKTKQGVNHQDFLYNKVEMSINSVLNDNNNDKLI